MTYHHYPKILILPFFPSFTLPDVLYNPTDLIWKQGTPFETMTDRTAFIKTDKTSESHTFKYHVLCTDGTISVGIIYFYYLAYFNTVVPLTSCVFFPVGLSSLTQHFQQVLK